MTAEVEQLHCQRVAGSGSAQRVVALPPNPPLQPRLSNSRHLPLAGDKAARSAPKSNILDLSKLLDKEIHVKFNGGREVSGTLKGYDNLTNLVLDNCTEYLRDPEDPYKLSSETRSLGLVVCRHTAVTLICPAQIEPIANPFIEDDDDE